MAGTSGRESAGGRNCRCSWLLLWVTVSAAVGGLFCSPLGLAAAGLALALAAVWLVGDRRAGANCASQVMDRLTAAHGLPPWLSDSRVRVPALVAAMSVLTWSLATMELTPATAGGVLARALLLTGLALLTRGIVARQRSCCRLTQPD